METKCEYSTLTIPNDGWYTGIASKYVGEVAAKVGFDGTEREKIELGVSKALTDLMDYSFEPGEKGSFEITCERVPEGLRVAIHDQGIPFDPTRPLADKVHTQPDQEGSSRQITRPWEHHLDEVSFHNLGHGGKETVLIKYLKNKNITDYYQACDLGPYAAPPSSRPPRMGPVECTVRPMMPSEAVEVSKCIYRAYGYSYGYEHVYYPERLADLNTSGGLKSAVAVTPENEIVGHCALILRDKNSQTAEMGLGVVKPEFRSRGCFTRLTQYLIEQGRSAGLMGILGQAVTNHTFSQQAAHKLGLKDIAVLLGYLPTSMEFKGVGDALSQRVSVVVHFMYLHKPTAITIFPPTHHRELVAALYRSLGVVPTVEMPESHEAVLPDVDSSLKVDIITSLSVAHIAIRTYGRNVVEEVRARVRYLCLQKIELISLYLDLLDPLTLHLTGEFEKQGFFFAGILPGATPKGDALILQYLNNVPIDYGKIKVASAQGKDLLAYIERTDPNRI